MTALIAFLCAAALIVFDQVAKGLVASHMALGESVPLWENVLHFTYVQNDGAVFGSFSGMPYIFNTITVLIVLAAAYLLVRNRLPSRWLTAAVTLILAGGIGNLIDRFRLGYVIDFIDVKCFGDLWVWVFNIADCCVVCGCLILLGYYIVDWIRERRAAKAAPAPSETEEGDQPHDRA
ncbi:MAG: signal peptidase II [Clostridia bacterium]|nr:signal peptidase II [Clostridia bacterium]